MASPVFAWSQCFQRCTSENTSFYFNTDGRCYVDVLLRSKLLPQAGLEHALLLTAYRRCLVVLVCWTAKGIHVVEGKLCKKSIFQELVESDSIRIEIFLLNRTVCECRKLKWRRVGRNFNTDLRRPKMADKSSLGSRKLRPCHRKVLSAFSLPRYAFACP